MSQLAEYADNPDIRMITGAYPQDCTDTYS